MYVCQTICTSSAIVAGQVRIRRSSSQSHGHTSRKKTPLLSCHPYASVSAWIQLPRRRAHCVIQGRHVNITTEYYLSRLSHARIRGWSTLDQKAACYYCIFVIFSLTLLSTIMVNENDHLGYWARKHYFTYLSMMQDHPFGGIFLSFMNCLFVFVFAFYHISSFACIPVAVSWHIIMIFWFPLYIKLLSAVKHVLILIELENRLKVGIEPNRIDLFMNCTSLVAAGVTWQCVGSKMTAVFDLRSCLPPKRPVICSGLHKS